MKTPDPNDSSYSNYLYLRRHLGEEEKGDIDHAHWLTGQPVVRQHWIKDLVKRCDDLATGRDLSWGNYCALHPNHGDRAFNPVTWAAAPLFIRAAIIKPSDSAPATWTGEQPYTERQDDIPETEVVAW